MLETCKTPRGPKTLGLATQCIHLVDNYLLIIVIIMNSESDHTSFYMGLGTTTIIIKPIMAQGQSG